MSNGTPHSAEMIETVLALWNANLSAREIADRMGGGMTRNMVIGLVNHRKDRVTRAPPKEAITRRRNAEKARLQEEAMKKGIDPQGRPAGLPLAVVKLERHHCRFPINHPGEPNFAFCGETRQRGSSYCEVHRALCRDTAKTVEVRRGARKPDFTGSKQYPPRAA